jgi:hypothetical protein
MKYSTLIAAGFLGLMTAQQATAASTPFALRYEANAVSIHNGTTSQTVENTFGDSPLGLAFTGTNSYDFYSPPISLPIVLSTSLKTGGLIVMSNSAPTAANDFSVFGSMNFYDYDPVSGTDTYVATARQPANSGRKVVHGKTAQWNLVQAPQKAAYTIPAGHLLHIVVSLTLDDGDPGTYGQLIYNGPQGASTMALFPRNSALPVSWTMASLVQIKPNLSSVNPQPDQTVQINGTGAPSAYYLIQATSNVGDQSSWTTISTNMADSVTGSIQATDPDAVNHPFRFYRIATP